MSRNDQEDVGFLDLPDPNPTTATYYIDGGIGVDREKYNVLTDAKPICAKVIQNKITKTTTFFILCNSSNQMFDPKERDVRYKKRDTWKFRSVNSSTFDLYLRFLKHHYRSLLSQAEREL